MRDSSTILCKLYDGGSAARSWNGLRKLILENFDLDSPITAICQPEFLDQSLISRIGDGVYMGIRPGRRLELVVDTTLPFESGCARDLAEELEAIDDRNHGLDILCVTWILEKELDDAAGYGQTLAEVFSLTDAKVSIDANQPNTLIISGDFQPRVLFDADALRESPHLIDGFEGLGEQCAMFDCPCETLGAVPFRLSKEDALAYYARAIAAQRNLPEGFSKRSTVKSVAGIFVPYWLFDGSCTFDFTLAQRVECENRSDTIYRNAVGSFSFKGVPIDGSAYMGDEAMDTIGSFNFKSLIPLDSPELSGFMAESFSDTGENIRKRMLNLIGSSALSKAFDKYDLNGLWTKERLRSVSNVNRWVPAWDCSAVEIDYGKAARVLVPVWVVKVGYEGRTYWAYINGQTGDRSVNLPNNVDEVENKAKKQVHSALRIALIAAAVCCVFILAYALFSGNIRQAVVLAAIVAAIACGFYLFSDTFPEFRKKSVENTIERSSDKLAVSALRYFDNSSFSCSVGIDKGSEKQENNWPV